MKTLGLLLLLFCLPALGKDHPMQTAKVVSQNVGPWTGGSISTGGANVVGSSVIGNGISLPVLRAANMVVLETKDTRYNLVEITGRHYLLLTVNGTVDFYIDGNRAILEGGDHKKHKFFITRMEALN